MIELSGKSGSKLQGRFVEIGQQGYLHEFRRTDWVPRADVAEVYALIRDTSKDGALADLSLELR